MELEVTQVLWVEDLTQSVNELTEVVVVGGTRKCGENSYETH